MLHPDEQFDKLGTVGRETIGSGPIRLLDEDGNEVPDGSPGNCILATPTRSPEYWAIRKRLPKPFVAII